MVTTRAFSHAPDDPHAMAASTTPSSSLPPGHSSTAGQPVGGWRRLRARPHVWLAAVGIWAALGLASLAPRSLPDDAALPEPASRLLYHLVHILTLGALTGVVIWIARRTETWRLWSRLSLHVALAALFAGLVAAVGARAWRSASSGAPTDLPLAVFELHFLAYFAVLAITHALDFVAWRRDQRIEEAQLAARSARLEAQLARTELQILRSQLDPHFLFNALHVISELVHVDPSRADRVVARLGDLLRMSASLARSADVPLRDELAFVNAYLEIQQARFGTRLRIVRSVDAATLDAAVPSLLVQPLVENAIRHGTSRRATGGQIEIIVRRVGSSLLIEVRDDGPGLPADQPPDEGIGIGHTRARLAHLYGDESTLELEPRPGGGTTARVRLPFAHALPEMPRNGSAGQAAGA
jgi:two-component system LytT family sensor kinase